MQLEPARGPTGQPGGATRTSRHPGLLVGSRTARRAARSAVVWSYFFALTVASSAIGYTTTYKTAEQRDHLAVLFGNNTGLAAINGPARAIQTVAGYTAWKSFMSIIVVGAIWGLLTSTRLLRGEEEAGRWELLLAGPTNRRRATAQALVGLGAGLVVLWAVTAAVTVAVGQYPKVGIGVGPALYFSVAMVVSAGLFLAVGALTSQLAATRRQAASYAAIAAGVSYALRMVGDSGAGLGWLRWASPMGWIEELRPLVDPQPYVLIPTAALTLVLVVVTVELAGRRDVGSSFLPDRTRSVPRTRLLGHPFSFTLRLLRPSVIGWSAGVGLMALLMGFIAKEGGDVLTTSQSVESAIRRLGGHGAGAKLYLGFTFLIIAVMVGFAAVGQIGAARSEEAEGRLDHLLVRPVSRVSWLAGRVAATIATLVLLGLLAGFLAWVGAESQGAGVGLASLLGAGLNVIPPILAIVGIGTLALGVWPRATVAVAYGVLSWSVLLELAGGFVGTNHWLMDTSVFHHMASAPGEPPNLTSAAVLVAVFAATSVAGAVGFVRRDLSGE